MMIYVLYQAVLYKRIGLSFQEIKSSFTIFIGDVYFIMFLRWIFSMLLGVLLSNPVISFALIIIFSALPETIYLGNSHKEGLLLESINFLKNNWYFWIPLTFIGYVMQRVVFEQELLLNVPLECIGFKSHYEHYYQITAIDLYSPRNSSLLREAYPRYGDVEICL